MHYERQESGIGWRMRQLVGNPGGDGVASGEFAFGQAWSQLGVAQDVEYEFEP